MEGRNWSFWSGSPWLSTFFALHSLVCSHFAAKSAEEMPTPQFLAAQHFISHCKPLFPASSHLPELKSCPLIDSRTNILEGFCQNQFSSCRLELGEGGGLTHAMLILPRGSLRLSHSSLIFIRNWKFGGLALAFSQVRNCGCRWDGGKSGIETL